MTESESEHDWFTRQIPSALANGLSAEEQQRFEAHAALCPQCAAGFLDAKAVEKTLDAAFADLRPDAGLEDRIVAELPYKFTLPNPKFRRIAAAVAAVILLGGTGYVGLNLMNKRWRPLNQSLTTLAAGTAANQAASANNLRQIGQSVLEGNRAATAQPLNWDGRESSNGAAQTKSLEAKSLDSQLTSKSSDIPILAQGYTTREGLVSSGLAAASDRRVGGGGGGFGGGGSSAFTSNGVTVGPAGQVSPANELMTQKAGELDQDKVVAGKFDLGPTPSAAPEGERQALADNTPMSAAAAVPAMTFSTPSQAAAQTEQSAEDRKIIRSGEMKFEVDNFDAAYSRLDSIVHESRGYIGGTNSERLPNGKVHGTITVRVPPENLDLLVLKLRALGDLQSQQVTAQDITKEYTDLQSELRAAKAMEDRLLEIIKDGRGQVKDLLAVEKELGNWREKDEQVTGQINYYNNLVSLSTLEITLTEKDIGQAATATETETVSAGLETDDVPHTRDAVLKAVDAAKGRIERAELIESDDNQYSATIVAAIPPDAAGPVVDRLQQLGHVTRMRSHTEESISGESAQPHLKVERADTILNLSIYNVAAIPAQETDDLTLMPAHGDLQAAFNALLNFAGKPNAGVRVIDKDLDQENGLFTRASIVMEIPRQSLAQANDAIANAGKIVARKSARQPDSANVSDSKVLFNFSFVDVDALAPRQTLSRDLAVASVATGYQSILDAARAAGANVRVAQLDNSDAQHILADLEFDLPSDKQQIVQDTIDKAGPALGGLIARLPESDASTEQKVRFHLHLIQVDQIAPRRTIQLEIQTPHPRQASADVMSAALGDGAKVIDQSSVMQPDGRIESHLVVESPLSTTDTLADAATELGVVHANQSTEDATAPSGPAARGRVEIQFVSETPVVADDNGLAATIKQGLITSIRGLLWSVQLLVIGLCLIGPWCLIGWIGWRIYRKRSAARRL
jgi:hypothetical protein